MIRLPHRRSHRGRLAVAAALVAALAGTALAVMGGPATGAGPRTDVFTQDAWDDYGYEPSQSTHDIYGSPDIKACYSSLGCLFNQDPIVGSTSYVFVTLHNPGPYGFGATHGTLYLFRTAMGGAAQWPQDWVMIGHQDATIQPGNHSVVIPWSVPSVPSGYSHFCLLSVWVSASDPMYHAGISPNTLLFNLGPNTYADTRNNNNVSWRNEHILPIGHGIPFGTIFAVGNVTRERTTNTLVFQDPTGRFADIGGTLTVDLGPQLFQEWKAAGGRGTGIRVVGDTQIQIVDVNKATIDGLPIDPGTRPVLLLSFNAKKAPQDRIRYDIAQYGPDENGDWSNLGGVYYDIVNADDADSQR